MKTEFLRLVKKIKDTGIVYTLYHARSSKEIRVIWQRFLTENDDICQEALDWAYKFQHSVHDHHLFKKGEIPKNPAELCIVLRIAGNYLASEGEIFEDWRDLQKALFRQHKKLAKTAAEAMEEQLICSMVLSI